MTALSRRQVLAASAGALAIATLGAAPAWAGNNAQDLIKAFTGGKPATEGKVKLDLPEIAENGNTVPMTVAVDSPMTKDNYVKAIHVFNDKNPQPNVVSVQLGPRAGKAAIATRIRLAGTQKLMAIAEMSDGTYWADTQEVIVTLAACLEDLQP